MLKLGGIAVVAVWLVMTGLLVQREAVKGPEMAPASSMLVREDWMGIYLEGKKIGYAMTSVDKTARGYAITEEMLTELNVMGTRQDIRTVTHSTVDESLALQGFDFSLKSGVADMEINGAVKAGTDGGALLELDITTAGRTEKQELQLKDVPHMSSDIELYLQRQGLEVGKKFRLPFFDPAMLSQKYMDIEVEAKEELKIGDRLLPVYRVREDYAGVTARTWINPELGSIKGEGPMGFTFLKETKEQAMKPPEGGYGPVDIIAMISIPARGVPVAEPRKAVFMKARLSGADLSGLELAGDGQTFSDGIIAVSAEGPENFKPAALPITDASLAGYLKSKPYVQSDDPAIKNKAREIVGGETDAMKAARRLTDWVYKSVEKKPSAGIPSAVEVLGNLSGDCNEHTVLYTALARAAGIPARMDAGLVMLDGSFFYHAWPEVYVGRWITVDPTFGQFPADATHMRFATGGLDRQVGILKVVGKLGVEILEYR
jgi:hypothetical protein